MESENDIQFRVPVSQIDDLHDLQEFLDSRQFQVKEDAIAAEPDPRGEKESVLAVMLLVMATPMAVQFAKTLAESLHVYIKARIEANRPKLTVTLSAKDGGPAVAIELTNPQSVPELTQKLMMLGGGTDGSAGGGMK